ELGAPDRFGNHTLRIGEYNSVVLAGGNADAVWTGNSATGQQIVFGTYAVGFSVASTTPAAGSTVSSVPADYVVNFTNPVDPTTVNGSDFTVTNNSGTPVGADSFVINTSTQVAFHFNSAPFSTQGPHTMAVAAGSILRASDGSPVAAFSGTFRYDAVLLQVTSTNPPARGPFPLPAPLTSHEHFNH